MFIRTHSAQLWHLFVSLHFGITTNKWVMCKQRPRIWQPQDCQLRLGAPEKKKTPHCVFVECLVWGKRSKREMTFLDIWLAVCLINEVDGWNRQDSEGGESRGGDVGVPAVTHPVIPVHCETSSGDASSESHLTHLGLDYLSDRSWSTQRSPRKMTALKSMTRRVFSWKPGAILCCRDGSFQR